LQGTTRAIRTSYEVWSGKQLVSLQNTSTVWEALLLYLGAQGCRRDEIMRLGPDSVSWRGAVYRAVPVGSD
jgi:hypothetical protein